MIILGIDPGTATTGYGLVEIKAHRLSYVGHGTIQTAARYIFPDRLLMIYGQINQLIKKYDPTLLAVEQLFFAKNVKTALTVAQARGVVLLAGAGAGLIIEEYTPLQVKQTLTGYGRAQKDQIQKMVKAMLGLKEIPRPDDAADALAIAITAVHHHPLTALARMKKRVAP